MAWHVLADAGDNIQIWMVAENALNVQLRMADNVCTSTVRLPLELTFLHRTPLAICGLTSGVMCNKLI
jgi:hypothetical protein